MKILYQGNMGSIGDGSARADTHVEVRLFNAIHTWGADGWTPGDPPYVNYFYRITTLPDGSVEYLTLEDVEGDVTYAQHDTHKDMVEYLNRAIWYGWAYKPQSGPRIVLPPRLFGTKIGIAERLRLLRSDPKYGDFFGSLRGR